MVSFSTVGGINGTFTYIQFVHNLDVRIRESLVAKNPLMNVTQMKEHSNIMTVVCALIYIHFYTTLL